MRRRQSASGIAERRATQFSPGVWSVVPGHRSGWQRNLAAKFIERSLRTIWSVIDLQGSLSAIDLEGSSSAIDLEGSLSAIDLEEALLEFPDDALI
eukprot:6200842-Pleurochrysis_carterae.AAC.4